MKIEKAIALTEQAIELVRHQLLLPQEEQEFLSKQQGDSALAELVSMLRSLKEICISSRLERDTGLGRMVLDTFDNDSSLGDSILGALNAFDRVRRNR